MNFYDYSLLQRLRQLEIEVEGIYKEFGTNEVRDLLTHIRGIIIENEDIKEE